MNRRALLAGAALAPLGACGTLTSAQSAQLQRLIAGAQAIENSLATQVPLLLAAVKLPDATVAQVRAGLSVVVNSTNALAMVPTLGEGTTYLQAIATGVNVIIGAAAGVALIPEPYHTALVVAALALPPLEALVGTAILQGAALAATIRAKSLPAPGTVPT